MKLRRRVSLENRRYANWNLEWWREDNEYYRGNRHHYASRQVRRKLKTYKRHMKPLLHNGKKP